MISFLIGLFVGVVLLIVIIAAATMLNEDDADDVDNWRRKK